MSISPRIILLLGAARGFDRGLLSGISRYASLHGPWTFYREPHGYHEQFADVILALQLDALLSSMEPLRLLWRFTLITTERDGYWGDGYWDAQQTLIACRHVHFQFVHACARLIHGLLDLWQEVHTGDEVVQNADPPADRQTSGIHQWYSSVANSNQLPSGIFWLWNHHQWSSRVLVSLRSRSTDPNGAS